MCVYVCVTIECPVAEVNDYRVEVLVRLRKLEKLDKDPYTEDERADAEEVIIEFKAVLRRLTNNLSFVL